MAKKSDGVIKHKIVLEGEKEYKKALTDISRAQRVTASELKANKSAYDGAGESQEALTSRLDILTKAHEQADEKVKLLTEHLKKVEAAYGESSAEADRMHIAINNAQAAASKLGNEANDLRKRLEQMADSADDAEKEMDDLGEASQDGAGELKQTGSIVDDLKGQLTDAAMQAGKLGGAIAGIGGTIKIGLEVGQEANQAEQVLATQTGLYGDALKEMQENAQALMQSGFFSSLTQAASAMSTVYQNTQLTGTALEEATRDAQLFDTVFGIDIPESSKTANALMKTFGISAEAAYNLMAHGVQNGANKNGDLMDVLAEYGPMFKQMGFSSEEFVGVLERGAQSGTFSVDKIGDAMKEFYLRMTDGNADAKEALKSMGLESEDVMKKVAAGGETGRAAFDLVIDTLAGIEDPVRRNQLAVSLFGTQAEDMGYNVVGMFSDIDDAAADAEGTMGKINDVKFDDLDVQINRLAGNLKNSFGPIAEWFTDQITGAIKTANDVIEGKTQPLPTPVDPGVAAGQAAANIMLDTFRGGPSSLQNIWKDVKSLFAGESEEKTQAQAAAEQSGADTAAGFVGGIEGGTSAAANAGIMLGYSALGGLNQAMMIHSPSEATQESGEYFDEGLVDGIEAGQPDAERSAADLGRGVIEAARREMDASSGRDIGRDWSAGIAQGISASQGQVRAAAQRVASIIESTTRSALDTHSPSRVGEDIGMDWGAGIALGEVRSMDAVRDAALGISDMMIDASTPSGAGAAQLQIDYDRLGEAVADACVRRGLGVGDLVAVFDREDAIDQLTPGISQRIARDASLTVAGRAKRL